MINRNEAYKLLQKYIKNEKLIKHSIAVEAIMKKIAYFLQEDINMWSLVGLLHDIDYEYTINNPESHATVSAQILEGLIPDNCINAIKSHNYIHTKYIPITSIDKSLIASDAVSGLLISSALVMPSKKINEVKLSTLTKKYKDKTFCKLAANLFDVEPGIMINEIPQNIFDIFNNLLCYFDRIRIFYRLINN